MASMPSFACSQESKTSFACNQVSKNDSYYGLMNKVNDCSFFYRENSQEIVEESSLESVAVLKLTKWYGLEKLERKKSGQS